ncbi:hypothetical protein Q1695_003472 [Nippostrongylus brasiliensis]|nr:hypothetical protein Q1695_003472 [Nippostrongylus brasiliensis]
MLLSGVIWLLSTATNIGETASCPYQSLTSEIWRKELQREHRRERLSFAQGRAPARVVAEQMNDLVWNCETEFNLQKIIEQLPQFSLNVTYRNFGVNVGRGSDSFCDVYTMFALMGPWYNLGTNVVSSLIYDGSPSTFNFANMAKWNATEFACTYKLYNDEAIIMLICAYNVKGAVVGEAIYEKANDGKYLCDEGAQCGTNGRCVGNLCRESVSDPDVLLPIYYPTMSCASPAFMNQFSRYYALNLHNYYRRLVASGWAENKLTRFTLRAARMEALTYDCSLEEAANEHVKKCERQPAKLLPADTGSNIKVIDDVGLSKEAALERATGEWFSQLHKYGMDPNSVWTENATIRDCANMVHDKYKTVGCAVNICSSNGFTIIECRYGPKRLQEGNLIYEALTLLQSSSVKRLAILTGEMKTFLLLALSAATIPLPCENAASTHCTCVADSTCYTPSESWLELYSNGRLLLSKCTKECISREVTEFFGNEKAVYKDLSSRCYVTKCPCLCQSACNDLTQMGYFQIANCLSNMGNGSASCNTPTSTTEQSTVSSSYVNSDNTILPTSSLKVESETTFAMESTNAKTSSVISSGTVMEAETTKAATSIFSLSSRHSTTVYNFAHVITKSSSLENPTSTVQNTEASVSATLSSSPPITELPLSPPSGTPKALSTSSSFTAEHETTPATTVSATSNKFISKEAVNSDSSTLSTTLKPISTSNTVPPMERKTTPVISSQTLYEITTKTSTGTTALKPLGTQESFSSYKMSTSSLSTLNPKTTTSVTSSTTLYEILSKTSAGPTSSPHIRTEQPLSTLDTFSASSTTERKTKYTTLYDILSGSYISSTPSLPFEIRDSSSTSSAKSTTERKTRPTTSSVSLYDIFSKSTVSSTSSLPFQWQESLSSASSDTMVAETTPTTRSATLYEILSKSAASTTGWSSRSKTSTDELLVSGTSLSHSPTEQPVLTTKYGKVTGSPSPSANGDFPSITSTSLKLEKEATETRTEKSLSFRSTLHREMVSSTALEPRETTFGIAKDMSAGLAQEGFKQSTDGAGATGRAQTSDATVRHLKGLTTSVKVSAVSTFRDTAVYDYETSSNKASSVTSTSYTEIYASTGILSTVLKLTKSSTASGQTETVDDQATTPFGEPSEGLTNLATYESPTRDLTARQTVSPPNEPAAVPSSTSTIVPPSFDMTTLMLVPDTGLDESTGALLASKLSSTQEGFENVSSLATAKYGSAIQQSPTTNTVQLTSDSNLDHSSKTTSDASLQSTTRDFQCVCPCPIGLLEGPDYCYHLLKPQPIINYRKAFQLCAVEGSSDMADEVDLRDPQVLQLLRNASETDGAEARFFVNERDSKPYMEEKKVRIVSLKWSTRFFLNVNETVAPRQYVENVTAACKRPKFCGDYYCSLNDYEFLVPDSVLAIPETQNRTLAVGESVTIRCNNSETDVVKVQCRQKGYLSPHPTRVACQEDRKLAFLKRHRIRKSCKECFPYGTERCERVPEGFVCRCRTNWTARCICNATFAGSHCSVNKTRLSFISDTEASFVSGTTAGASIITMTGSLVLLIRAILAFFGQQQGNDPQTFYQNCRCFTVALAGIFAFLFRHPALLQISQIQCMFSSFVMTCSFLFVRKYLVHTIQEAWFREYFQMAKWNATEFACTYKLYNDEAIIMLMCAYNVKGAVVGEAIYEKANDGKYLCDEGAQCGTNGTCVGNLCRESVSDPDVLLPIYSPTMSCASRTFMNQFSRYYALNLHNYYRRLVASGWAENKLTRFTLRAARMEALTYDCSLEEAAEENVKKCERQPSKHTSADTGSNIKVIDDVGLSKEAALERATGEWFSQLHKYGMDPNSVWTENATIRDCANMVHDKYKTVGCAVNVCTSNGFTIVECRYGPKRLQEGNLIYEALTLLQSSSVKRLAILTEEMRTFLLLALSAVTIPLPCENAASTHCTCIADSTCYTPSDSWLELYSNGRLLLSKCTKECMSREVTEFFDNEKAVYKDLSSRCYVTKCPCLCQSACNDLTQMGYFQIADCLSNMGNGSASCNTPTSTTEQSTASSSYVNSDNTILPTSSLKVESETTFAMESTTAKTSLVISSGTVMEAETTKAATSIFSLSSLHSTTVYNFAHVITKSSSLENPTSTIRNTEASVSATLSSSPPTAELSSSPSSGTPKALSTVPSSFTTVHETTPATTVSATLNEFVSKEAVNSYSSTLSTTLKPISTTNTVPPMERKTTPVISSQTLYGITSKTSTGTTAWKPLGTQKSFSSYKMSTSSSSTLNHKTTTSVTSSITLHGILSKTSAGPTSSPHIRTEQPLSTLNTFSASSTTERKTKYTTLYDILSKTYVSSTPSLPFETRNSGSTSSAKSTTERKARPTTSSVSLYDIFSKSTGSSTSSLPFQWQESLSSASSDTMVTETSPTTRSATLYEILSKSAASTTGWSSRSKTSTVEPLVSGKSLLPSPTEQPVLTTRSGKVTGSPSPSGSGDIPSITSTSLKLGKETTETRTEESLSYKTTLHREIVSSTALEPGETTFGIAKDMSAGLTQEGFKQSTDGAGATGRAQTSDTTVRDLEDLTTSVKVSAVSTLRDSAVYDYETSSNKASSVTSTSYAEIYASTGILSTVLKLGKASTTSVQTETGDDRATSPFGEPSEGLTNPATYESPTRDLTSRQTVSPPSETAAVPSSTSTFVSPSFDMTTLMLVPDTGLNKSTGALPASKLPTTQEGFENVSSLATAMYGSATQQSPTTNTMKLTSDSNLDHSSSTTSDASLQSTTRDFQCVYPCPIGLLEGPDYCYHLLKPQPIINYRKAFQLCAIEGSSDMADEVDLRDPQVLQLLRNASETDGAEARFFVNERDSKLYMEEKKVRIVSLKWSTRFFLNVNETVAPRQYVENVTAACKRPKFCGDYYCNLNDYKFLVPDSVLAIPETQNRTLAVGESITIRCNNSETDVVKVQCRQKGYISPHPTRVACQEDRKLAFLKRHRIRKSCKECFPYGTERCDRVLEGFVCRCRTNWTARCICNATFAGSHCSVNKTKLSFISDTEASFVSGTTAGASIVTMTGSLVLLIRAILAFYGRKQGNVWHSSHWKHLLFTSAHLNSWTETLWGRKRWYTSPAFRTLTPLVVLTAAVAGAFKAKPADVATSWSCLGRFDPTTRDFWFPLALAHSCLGLAAFAYTLEGLFKRQNMPQFQQVVDEYLKPLPPSRREEVEKCQRNYGLTAIGPWLLYTTWLFLALSADWVVSPTNYWAVACALGYAACELAIFTLTTPRVYSTLLCTWTKFLPKRASPEADPVPPRQQEDLRVRHRPQRRLQRRRGRRPRVNRRRPGRKAPISSKMGKRLKRRWTAHYKKLRRKNQNKTKAQIVRVVYRKKVKHDLYQAKSKACRKRIRQLFNEWWTETYTADKQPDAVLKLKTRVDMYLEERAALISSLRFLRGDRRGQAAEDQPPQEPADDKAIPLCYVSTVDEYGNTKIEEVMKTPAELADLPSTSRQQQEDGGEGGHVPNHEESLAWIQELTDSTFKMAIQNYDYLERSRSLREWGPPL